MTTSRARWFTGCLVTAALLSSFAGCSDDSGVQASAGSAGAGAAGGQAAAGTGGVGGSAGTSNGGSVAAGTGGSVTPGEAGAGGQGGEPDLGPPNYTYSDLVHQLIDLESLSMLPMPGEKTAAFSSYDRASKYDAAADKYTNWGANDDGRGLVATLGDGSKVLADMKGPGCIRRINSGSHSGAHVKIYIDDSPTPAIDLTWDDYFSAKQAPFDRSSLVYEISGGLSNYTPIPYQKSCKVVADASFGPYFYVEYSTFPEGTTLPSYSAESYQQIKAAFDEVDTYLRTGLGTDPAGMRAGATTSPGALSIAAGKTSALFDASGAGAVTAIKLKVKGLKDQAEQWAALRELTISMSWDGESAPSVWAPLGDFFGTAAGLRQYSALPLGVLEDGTLYSYWYMPYGKGAHIEIGNDGPAGRDIEATITTAPLSHSANRLGRFHAKWNRNAQQPGRADRWPDYTVLKTQGRGRFLGFMQHIYKPDDKVDPMSAPGDYWWGEGDEKFFVDDEKMPSWFGTGSEDYFGYAWATPDYFSKPYHTQLFNQGSIHWKGNRVLNRFQISDAVPFGTSFEAAIEKYYTDTYARYGVMPYWYLEAGGTDPYGPVSLPERTNYYQAPAPGDASRLEGEELWVVSQTQGSLTPQFMDWAGSNVWSHDLHLFWYDNNLTKVGQGGQAVVRFDAPSAGGFDLVGVFTKAYDYGIVQLEVDGSACGAAIDLYHDGPIPSGELALCHKTLTAGHHELRFTLTGKNAASAGYYLGVDYLKLVSAP